MKLHINPLLAGLLFVSLSQVGQASELKPITIAGGNVHGVYFQIATELCRLVTSQRPEQACSVLSSEGSAENLQLLRNGVANTALVQGDLLYWAQRGEGPYQGEAMPGLRAIMATHAEPLTLMVRQNEVTDIASLQGRPLYLGSGNSGSRITAQILLTHVGLADVKQQEVAVDEPAAALCDKKIAAWALVIGHPNQQVLNVAKRCAIGFLPLKLERPQDAAEHPFYRVSQIPGRLYPGVLTSTTTLALPAILVTTDKMDADAVNSLITSYWQNRNTFNKKVSAYANLFRLPAHMKQAAELIPMHPAAIRAFDELP
ncbi:MAG: TAXI family TRAP transporter solute-binding subunit [Aeromonadaceae bacterium]